jgi:hypothetical protein
MYLENGRDIVRGVMILLFVAMAYWSSSSTALALVGIMGLMILQSAFTDWCPADIVLRPMGFKKKRENNR